MRENFEFHSQMLLNLLNKTCSDKINFSDITNWHPSHPYYRLNYYKNIQISQVLGIYLFLNKDFLSQFSDIVEIGSYNGGLSSYIYDTKPELTSFISYDIDPNLNQSNRKDINFRIKDCFEAEKEIGHLITNRDHRTLIICDGGHKTKEFITFSKYMKPGDVIILHDYKQDDESWKEYTDYWQWPYGYETTYEDIEETIKSNKLVEYNNKAANFYLWGSFQLASVY